MSAVQYNYTSFINVIILILRNYITYVYSWAHYKLVLLYLCTHAFMQNYYIQKNGTPVMINYYLVLIYTLSYWAKEKSELPLLRDVLDRYS